MAAMVLLAFVGAMVALSVSGECYDLFSQLHSLPFSLQNSLRLLKYGFACRFMVFLKFSSHKRIETATQFFMIFFGLVKTQSDPKAQFI